MGTKNIKRKNLPFSYIKLLIQFFIGCYAIQSTAQNVGIGTQTPFKKLSVNGTIVVDHNNTNSGSMDSAALWFGTAGGVGIASNKVGEGNTNDLTFFTANQNRMNISMNGNVGIGIYNMGAFKFQVNGTSNFMDNIFINGVLVAEDANVSGELILGTDAVIGENLNVGSDGIIGNNFRVNGRAGINGPTNANYGLYVNNSNSYFQGNITASGSASTSGSISTSSNLSAGNNLTVGNDGIIENNFRVNGRVGINGATNAGYGLMVNNSNSYFQGNITATGTINASGNLTVKGNGHVRSNGPSNLKIGFTSKSVNINIANGSNASVIANISEFTGDNDDVRVFVSQVVSDAGGVVLWPEVNITVMNVNSANGTCLLWLYNNSGVSGILKGTIYLTTISKD